MAEKKNNSAKKQPDQTGQQILQYGSFSNPDALCDFINEKKIKPFSINVSERLYLMFYYENE